MKKRFLALLLAIIVVVPCFCGCSCSSLNTLSFTNAFYGSDANKPRAGYKETLVYDVTYSDAKKDSSLTKDYLDFSFSDGKYTSTLEIYQEIPEAYVGKFTPPADGTRNLYKLETEFSIKSHYVGGGKTYDNDDKITSVVFFNSCDYSFTPIYSETHAKYAAVYSSNGSALIKIAESNNSITYNDSNYTVKAKNAVYDLGDENPNFTETEKSYDYESRTLIDNAQLLFSLRNASIEEEGSLSLPVVSVGYGEYKTLLVKNTAETQRTVKVNDEEKTITVKNLTFAISSQNDSGVSQTVVIQKNIAENEKAWLVSYSEPLIMQNSAVRLGALDYELKQATYTNA